MCNKKVIKLSMITKKLKYDNNNKYYNKKYLIFNQFISENDI